MKRFGEEERKIIPRRNNPWSYENHKEKEVKKNNNLEWPR